jgi:ribosomal protein L3 glutamine methyltransferase
MSQSLFHRRARRVPLTVGALIARGARRLQRAQVYFGHGTDNARDESALLVQHALGLPYGAGPGCYAKRVSRSGERHASELLRRRIRERMPAAYLTGVAGFAGLIFRVDPRVLIPRSPIAELIEQRFAPWVDPERVRRVLDIGTGSAVAASPSPPPVPCRARGWTRWTSRPRRSRWRSRTCVCIACRPGSG